jgi:hypothetical protein
MEQLEWGGTHLLVWGQPGLQIARPYLKQNKTAKETEEDFEDATGEAADKVLSKSLWS